MRTFSPVIYRLMLEDAREYHKKGITLQPCPFCVNAWMEWKKIYHRTRRRPMDNKCNYCLTFFYNPEGYDPTGWCSEAGKAILKQMEEEEA
jgi:hypothetical protein